MYSLASLSNMSSRCVMLCQLGTIVAPAYLINCAPITSGRIVKLIIVVMVGNPDHLTSVGAMDLQEHGGHCPIKARSKYK